MSDSQSLVVVMSGLLAGVGTNVLANVIYEFARRARQNKRLNVLDPSPQNTPLHLSQEDAHWVDAVTAIVELEYDTPVQKLDEEQVLEVSAALGEVLVNLAEANGTFTEATILSRLAELRSLEGAGP